MANWLDSDARVHPCCFESAYKGFEIMMGMCRSAAQGGQVALPLAEPALELALLKQVLADKGVLLASPAHAKEFGV